MTPKEYKQMMDYLTRSGIRKQIKFASDIAKPDPKPQVKEIELFNAFNRRNPRADGGRIGFKNGPRKIYKVARPITDVDRKQNPNIPKDAKFKMQVPGGKFRGKSSSTEMIYDTSKSKLNKRLKDIESDVYVKPSKPKEPIPDDKFFVKKSSKRIKENINEIEYEEVLGKKNQPNTFKPTGKIVKKYKPFVGPDKVTIPGQGADNLKEAEKFVADYFKKNPKQIRVRDPQKDYASKDVRKKALKETDPTKAAGTKKFQYHHIRQIAGGVPLTTDDVMIINQRINSALGTKYNQPLNAISEAIRKNNKLALEAMNTKNEGAALDYMKRVDELNESAEKIVNSAIDKLPKKYKGYVGFNQFTLPRDEYGLPISNEPIIIRKVGGMPVSKDAIDLTTLNLKQEKEFRDLVKTQAQAGKTGQIKGLAAFIKRNFPDGEIVCNLSKGINCNNPQAYQKSINQLTQKAKQGDKAARSTLTRFTNIAGNAGRFIRSGLGPLAIASEIAIEGGIALNKTLQTGVPLKTAFADSLFNLALGPKTKIDKEAELAKEFAKGEEFAMAERGRRMMIPQSATADAQRQRGRMEQMASLYPQYSDQQLINMLEDAGYDSQDFINQQTTTRITPAVTSTLSGLDQLRTGFQEQDALQRIATAGGVANLAGGGIAGLSGGIDEGPQIRSMNPDSQGLSGLLKRGIKG